jgi:FtsX-like permease family
VSSQVLRVALYRLSATLRRQGAGYLTVVLLVGLLGGVALASIAGARRTQSSYPTFLASTNPSDMTVSTGPANSSGSSGSTSFAREIARLAGVKRVRDLVSPTVIPLDPQGVPRIELEAELQVYGSLDGDLLDQDRLTAVEGRLADPNRTDEIVMTSSAAHVVGVHVGQTVPLGFYTPAQTALPGFGTPHVAPRLRIQARLVGIVVFNSQVVQDDVDRANGFVVLTPALIREVAAVSPAAATPVLYGLQLVNPGRDVPEVEQEFIRAVPPGSAYEIHVASRLVAQVELAVEPESVALAAFGAIAALVALVLGIQAISRQLRIGEEDRRVLRALGAGPAAAAADGLIGVLIAVVLGSLLAVALALAISPLAPLGPVRPVYPDSGIAADWTVLGIGFVVLMGTLGIAALSLSYRGATHRVSRGRPMATRGSSATRGAEAVGLPVVGVMGVRFALDRARGGTEVPARSVLLGTVLAVTLLVATLTFASSLSTLVSHPALYGWNWSYVLDPTSDVPPQALELLNHDHDLAAWSGVSGYASVQIDDQNVPILVSALRPKVAPPILSGHGLDAENEIVLGEATLAELHKHVGDTVTVSYGNPADAPIYVPPTRVKVVGTATFPAVGSSSFIADHTSMGTGALIPTGIEPRAFQRALRNPDPNLNGPELVLVRLRDGVSLSAGRVDLQRIAHVADEVFASDSNAAGNAVTVEGVQRPAQIVNYRSIGSTPLILAVGLAVGALVALALTLVASVRYRRRDLALLKALGLTPRQLSSIVAWQSTVAAIVGIVLGIPLGIVIGRQLWILFAQNIDAVPDPTVPVLSMILVVLGSLFFANLVAALPARAAARTPTAILLRVE